MSLIKRFEDIPKVKISHGPTPIETAERLSQQLGCQLLFKRDDCTGLAGGGNKTRKLEYLIADALKQGADTLVTIGGLQSNHARQTAAGAAKFGLSCELVLEEVPGTPKQNYSDNGNVLLDNILGAKVHKLTQHQQTFEYVDKLLADLKNQGKKPYLVPVGGSNVIGSLGYVNCAFEIAQQIESEQLQLDQIVLASGSGGTQAGLLAGLIAKGIDIPVLGINVSRSTEAQNELVTKLLKELLSYLGLSPTLADGKVHTNGSYFGAGYGIVNDQTIKAVKTCASLEGILLDPVYTGKAMLALMEMSSKGEIAANSRQLFVHTGGSPGLFGYCELF